MSDLPVIKHPNDILRQKSENVSEKDLHSKEVQDLIDSMIETMNHEKGVGLAGPQVGKHLRIIIAETKDGSKAFVNPKIIARSEKMVDSQEGCLSIPGVFGIVKRHDTVKVKAKDRNGDPVRLKTDGLLSVIFQHEIDHLDGILFIDKAEKIIEGEAENTI